MNLAPNLGFLIHDVARVLRKRFEQRAKHMGLTRSQWQTIVYLARNEGLHQSGLAEMLEIEPITLMRVLDKLVERGFIERRRHKTDRRISLLYTTDLARGLLSDMRAIGDATRSEALDGISDDDRERLVAILELMKSNLLQACRAPADKETQNG
ncbi:MarR family winged helix-turn-helix transcriptional regulator [Rhizobium sp. Root482]|uniref:MarR family winged helix-turn-helix transcriptional regulator n=1 Tax=Rhizobium sp. Root482 TaxID=1736543 RepID=UPI0006F950B1|nr:MarR family transcriptional regulator [Rhizobium sp. Root482]KQY11505.1 MarR family transcriptional regulator [Rhizobium sp. Root482]